MSTQSFRLLLVALFVQVFGCAKDQACEEVFSPGTLIFPHGRSVTLSGFARPTLQTCICDGIDNYGTEVSVRKHFSEQFTESIITRLRFLQENAVENLPNLLYDGEFATNIAGNVYATARLVSATLDDFLAEDLSHDDKCAAIARAIQVPIPLWLTGFSLGNFYPKSILFDSSASQFVIDDLSTAHRVYSANQIESNVQSDLASFLSSVDIPLACEAEITYRCSVIKHFIGNEFRSTFSAAGCPKCADLKFQHLNPHSREATPPQDAMLPVSWDSTQNTMEVELGNIGYAIVFIDSLTHAAGPSGTSTEQHLGVTKDELEMPKYTGLTIASDPNGSSYYRASYYVYPNPRVRSQRQKIHVPKDQGGQGLDQEVVLKALNAHIKKTKRAHPEYEIDQNAGKLRSDLNRPMDLDDGEPLSPSPYVGISIEPNSKRTYRAHFRIGEERVDITRLGANGRDIEKVRQALLDEIEKRRRENPGIDINPDYGRLRSEVEAEKQPFPFMYMHYLMERSPGGAFPSKRPKNKRKIFFSKDLIHAQRECNLQNVIEQCESSPPTLPLLAPEKCIALCPASFIFTAEPDHTFNPLIAAINTEILGISTPQHDAGPSNLEDTEFGTLAKDLHTGVPCSYFHGMQQNVLFAGFEVNKCGDLQSKMLLVGCCDESKLPPLLESISQFLQDQIPEEGVGAHWIGMKNNFYMDFTLIFTILTLYTFICTPTQSEQSMKAPLLVEVI